MMKNMVSIQGLCFSGLVACLTACAAPPRDASREYHTNDHHQSAPEDRVTHDRHPHFPEFSWDTLPLYIHVRKVTAFDQKELEYLASFPLITFEKTTGSQTYGSTDAGTIEAAKAVKQINPKARVLFYRNVLVHYGGYSFDTELADIEAPFLRDKRGKGKLVRGTVEGYDLSNPRVVDWWVKGASAICANDAIDGVFLDGNIKVLVPYLDSQLPAGKKEAVKGAYHGMMKRTREAMGPGKLMVANLIRARMPDSGLQHMVYFDGSYLEAFTHPIGGVSKADYIVKGIEAVQTAARQGKIIAMTLGLGESAAALDGIDDTRKKLEGLSGLQRRIDFCIALFLVCAEKYSYLNLPDGYCVDTRNGRCESKMWLKRLPEYDRPLGPPKSHAVRHGYIFTREFAHASVWVDVQATEGKIEWHHRQGAPE